MKNGTFAATLSAAAATDTAAAAGGGGGAAASAAASAAAAAASASASAAVCVVREQGWDGRWGRRTHDANTPAGGVELTHLTRLNTPDDQDER